MELLGLTWDHPRGIDPLRAVSEEYERANGTRVRWEARPLWSFEDTPLTELSERYDILAIDHPSIGDAVKAGAIVPLDAYLSAEQLADRAGDSAGASYLSYSWQGQQWALGVDAACMVTAFLSGEVDEADIPAHWSDIAGFSARVGRESVLLPANPTHMLCTFLSLCEFVSTDHSRMIDGSPTWWTQEGVNRTIAGQAFDILLDLLGSCDPMSMRTDPITALDRLVNPTDAVQYIPLVFGYVTYSLGRQGQSRAIFVDAPGGVGTLTGGVGLAVSAQSVSPRQAADFVQFASCQRSQQGTYVTAGGQPASLGAWRDPNANVATAGFFQGTLDTLQKSFLRPRAAGYPQFQRDAADAIHSAVAAGATAPQLVDLLDDYWSRIGA